MIRRGLLVPPVAVRALGWAFTVAGALLLPGAITWMVATADPPEGALRPEMMALPAGTFTMGSPEDEAGRSEDEAQREVRITQPFAIARTEVTQAMFRRVTGVAPSCAEHKGVPLLGDDLPVQCVTWTDAVAYLNRLSELEGLEPAYVVDGDEVAWSREATGFRLPTEAEWEYAARAGTIDVYAGTSDPGEVCRFGNVYDASAKDKFPWEAFACNDGIVGLARGASLAPNPWGLFDMMGNVWEWTWDLYAESPEGGDDPVGPESGSFRVGRGGSWSYVPRDARVAARGGGHPSLRSGSLGIRPARSLPSAL